MILHGQETVSSIQSWVLKLVKELLVNMRFILANNLVQLSRVFVK